MAHRAELRRPGVADARVWLAEAYLESGSPWQAEVQFRESLG